MTTEKDNIKRILNYVSNTMYKPNLNSKDYINLERKLKYCIHNEDENDNLAEIIYARLLYEQGRYLSSRVQYNRAKLKNPNRATIYYGIYKTYIMESKWDLALENLNIYLSLLEEDKRVDGFNIIYALLSYLRDESIEIEIPLDIYLSQEIKDSHIEVEYESLIEDILNANYVVSVKKAEALEKYCREKDNYMEFITLHKILMSALNKKREELNQFSVNNINEAIKTKDYGFLTSILYYNIGSPRVDIIKYIPILIENGYHLEAKDILNQLQFNRNNRKIRAYYRRSIREHEIIGNYTEEELEFHNSSVESIENALMYGEYFDAYDMASASLYRLNHPIFLYYMGLSAFYLEKYREAISCFNAYNRRGAKKTIESRFFLICSYKNLGGGKIYRNHRRRYVSYANLLNKPRRLDFYTYSYEPIEECEFPVSEANWIYNRQLYLYLEELFKQKRIIEAEELIKSIEHSPKKSQEEKLVLEYINKNKKILLNQNK